jgi:hypothetical protein
VRKESSDALERDTVVVYIQDERLGCVDVRAYAQAVTKRNVKGSACAGSVGARARLGHDVRADGEFLIVGSEHE